MTAPAIDIPGAAAIVRALGFGRSGHGRVGVEAELLTFRRTDPATRPTPEEVLGTVGDGGPLPCGSAVSAEPGGQLELSTLPREGLEPTLAALAADLAAARARLAAADIGTVAVGLDPLRPPVRVSDAPRYVAMETYFDTSGPAGRTMMCNTASIQVNLDLDGPAGPAGRWQLAHAVGPVLAAAFACSPASTYRSARTAVWGAIDPTRTRSAAGRSTDPADDWAAYALHARVMLIRTGDTCTPVRTRLTLADWIRGAHDGRPPDADDVGYHLTTLFPPVRPRGRLELRMIDALGDPWWRVAVAVTTALFDDGEAGATAALCCRGLGDGAWSAAARHGLSHPRLASAARALFDTALGALGRLGAGTATLDACAAYAERFVTRGRTPADELADAWHAHPPETLADLAREPVWT